MKITKVKIKNMFGISTFESGSESLELTGKNGRGKTSVIDAIRYALEHKSDRDFIVKDGSSEGEIIIETDDGVSISRNIDIEKDSDNSKIKKNGALVSKPESFLRTLFVPIQLNPVEFIAMDRKEQNRTILNLIQFDWDMDWIKEKFGEIPTGVDYAEDILEVLRQIQDEKGVYFQTRQEINRSIKEKKAVASDLSLNIPAPYDYKHWQNVNLGSLFTELEKARAHNSGIEKAKIIVSNAEGKHREIEADYQINLSAIDKAAAADRNRLEKDIENLKAEIKAKEVELAGVDDRIKAGYEKAELKKNEAMAKACSDIDAARAKAEENTIDTVPLQQKADKAEEMKSYIGDAQRLERIQEEVEENEAKSEELTRKIELARNLPAEILETATLPVKGLTIVEGEPRIHNMPVSNLSEGEKLDLCVDIACQNNTQLRILLIDGAERLATDMREALYARCAEKGVQFIATRTTDEEELCVMTMENVKQEAVEV